MVSAKTRDKKTGRFLSGDPEQVKRNHNERGRAWKSKHPDYYVNYRATHREENRKRCRRYYREHRESILKKVHVLQRERRVAKRQKLIEHFGGKCSQCGIMDFRVLQVNHINGGGAKERREVRGQDTIYAQILRGERQDEFELLCANCHVIRDFIRRGIFNPSN